MKSILPIIILAIYIFPSVSFSTDIKFFNSEMLGQPPSVQSSLLEGSEKDESALIKPKMIQIEIDDGLYSASSIYYDATEIDFNDLVKNIDQKYPNSRLENLSWNSDVRWRVEDEKFAISLNSQKEEGMFRVMYIRFMPTEKIMKHLMDTIEAIDKNCNPN